jgi:hypothetical protein
MDGWMDLGCRCVSLCCRLAGLPAARLLLLTCDLPMHHAPADESDESASSSSQQPASARGGEE